MIEVQVTSLQLQKAHTRLSKFQFNSSRGLSMFGSEKDRTLFGYLGEQIIIDYLGIQEANETFEYDLIFRNKKIEVKSVSCKFKPLSNYLCTVNSYDLTGVHQQDADYYVFVRIINDKTKAWILGYYPCKKFFQDGTFVKKGTQIAPGIIFEKANGTVMQISKLLPIESIFSVQ